MNPVHFTIMESVCCVCERRYGSKDGKGITKDSHGYCPECRTELWALLNNRTVEGGFYFKGFGPQDPPRPKRNIYA